MGPSASLAAAALGICAILQRTRSVGCRRGSQHFQNKDRDTLAGDRTHSPVRANSKRRRSVASVFRPEIGARHARYASYGIDVGRIELFQVDRWLVNLVIVHHVRALPSWARMTIETMHLLPYPAHAVNLGRHQARGAHHEAEPGDAIMHLIMATLGEIMTISLINEATFPGQGSANPLKCLAQDKKITHSRQIRMVP